MRKLILGLALAGATLSSHAADDTSEVPAGDVVRAQAAIKELGGALRTALQARIQSEGAPAAVDFCHDQAPRIAAEVAAKHQVSIGRTALRLRNPANAPLAWQEDVLAEFARAAAGGAAVQDLHRRRVVDTPQGPRVRYAQAIRTEGPCLACHGLSVAEPIRTAIARHYPEDRATGFAEGDLRGMFSVEFPASTDTR